MTSTSHTRTTSTRPTSRPTCLGRGRPHGRRVARHVLPVGPFLYSCPVCDLASLPAGSRAEAVALGRVHDRLHHRGYRTATVTAPSRCESCRRAAATTSWSQPRAGAPFLLCQSCATLTTGSPR